MKVLVINAGSSSLKYQLLDTESGEVMAKGLCERIGIDGVLTHTGNKSDEKFKFDIAMPTHKEAIQSVINVLLDPEKGVISSMSEIDAVGHRVVHGGEFFTCLLYTSIYKKRGRRGRYGADRAAQMLSGEKAV